MGFGGIGEKILNFGGFFPRGQKFFGGGKKTGQIFPQLKGGMFFKGIKKKKAPKTIFGHIWGEKGGFLGKNSGV